MSAATDAETTRDRALLRAVSNHVLNIAADTFAAARRHTEKTTDAAATAVRAELSAELKAELDAATGGSFADVRDNLLRCLGTVTAPDVVLPRMEN